MPETVSSGAREPRRYGLPQALEKVCMLRALPASTKYSWWSSDCLGWPEGICLVSTRRIRPAYMYDAGGFGETLRNRATAVDASPRYPSDIA